MIDREAALDLLREPGPESHLVQHALASEAVMRALARHFGENEELWGLTGLLHDWDYPLTIRAHNAECNGCTVNGRFDVALRCGETVTGLISAAALVRPTGIDGMQVSSLKKKMKDKAFAASVNRDIIRQCADMGMTLEDFLALAIEAMSGKAAELGLGKAVQQQDGRL